MHMLLLERGESAQRASRLLELQLQSLHRALLSEARRLADSEVTSYLYGPYTAQNLAVRMPSTYHDDTLTNLGMGKRLHYSWNYHLPCLLGAQWRVLDEEICYTRFEPGFCGNVFSTIANRLPLRNDKQYTSDLIVGVIEVTKHAQCHT